jgi:uncharacterized protein YkwD
MLRTNYLFGLIATALLLVIFGSRGLSQQSLQQWIPVEQAGINSHSDRPPPWCPNGSFITQIDLDQQSGISAYDNPVIGRVRCGRLAGTESNKWASDPWWVPVEQTGINSHSSSGAPWCPNGSFIVQIDLDQQHGVSALDNPVIGKVRCASLTGYGRWSSTTNWIEIGPARSHFPDDSPWCPNGSFITQIDLDAASMSAHDSPVIGRVKCSYPASDSSVNAPATRTYQEELLRLTNAERQRAGLSPLRLSSQLGQAAQSHADDMAGNHFFSHTGSNGSDIEARLRSVGYNPSYWGENIAEGSSTPQETFQQWINSEGHRGNILNSAYTEVGFGYANNYWVQVFGRPR